MVLLQELQSVEFAMKKLESLVKESETSGVACGREKLSAACSDLEKIRSLKREVEALEAALKSKAGLKERLVLKQQVAQESESRQRLQRSSPFEGSSVGDSQDQSNGLEKRTWGEDADSFSTDDPAENRVYDDKAAKLALEEAAAVSQEAEAFELLRRELAVLETRVRRSAGRANADMVGLLICLSLLCNRWSHLPLRSFWDS
jgi:DNA primase